jgi:hypothetical protein
MKAMEDETDKLSGLGTSPEMNRRIDQATEKVNDEARKNALENPNASRLKPDAANKNIELATQELEEKMRASMQKASELEISNNEQAEAQRQAAQEKTVEELHKERSIKSLRTFKGDAAEAIEKEKTSLVRIKLAEEQKRTAQGETKLTQTHGASYGVKAVSFILSLLLILVGVSVFVVSRFFSGNSSAVPTIVYSTLMPYDKSDNVNVTNVDRSKVIETFETKRAEAPQNQSSVKYLHFVKAGAVGPSDLTTPQFLSLLRTKAPQNLLRALDDRFMSGTISLSGKSEPFIIIRIASFDNAYSGMLSWEETLGEDLGPLFTSDAIRKPSAEIAIAANVAIISTSTASTTTQTIPATIPHPEALVKSPFTDLVVSNIDTRAVRNDRGQVIMLYSFIDKNTLVMTTNENAFRGVVAKFIASKLIR